MRAINLDPDRYSPRARAILEAAGVVVDDGPLSHTDLEACIANYDVLILRFSHRLDAHLLARAKRLKVIATNATGVDHINIQHAEANRIRIVSLRDDQEFLRTVHATAELTWALILALERSLHAAIASVQKGEWNRDRYVGKELAGRSLGILGFGRIGEKIARYASAFGMAVGAYDIASRSAATPVIWHDTAASLFSASEIVTVHVPYNPDTQGLVDASLIARMPRGGRLINTARGAVVDEAAVVAALRSGHLGGVAVDVLAGEHEPGCPQASALWQLGQSDERVIITPHIGGAALEAWEKTEIRIAERTVAVLRDMAAGQE
ncbi:NAD(P)-dependent oxidoreductase [Mesorhizobium sp. AaZ16]|uniref:NAD(P)-dependent oxidoreductase n=1 Tax=Mesorhizobium sp. AaZ16 TaxID=3402289 RepID=UPI00374FCF54